MTPRIAICALLWLSLTSQQGFAAEAAPADTFLHQYAATYKFRLGRPVSIKVTPAGDAVLYLRSGPRDFVQNLYSFDPQTGRESILLTAEKVLSGAEENLSVAERARRERMRLAARGIAGYELSRDGKTLLVPLSGRLFVFDREQGAVRELQSAEGAIDPQLSFDATQVAFARDGDLWVTDLKRDTAKRLTRRENAHVTWGEAEFVAQEEMGRMHGFWWSPDGKTIACQRTDVSGVETFHIADPAHPESPPESWPYPRPGRANADVRLFLVPVRGSKPIDVPWDRQGFPYLARVVWEAGGPLTMLVQNREQTEEALLAVDGANGRSRVLLREHDVAWLNIDEDMPRWLEDGSGFLWTSEREGAWTLELRTPQGGLARRLTAPDFGYRGLEDVYGGREAWVRASADPTREHVWRVPLQGGEPTLVTHEPGQNKATLSRESDVWVETLEGNQRRYTVRRHDGASLGELPSVAEKPALWPKLELTTVGEAPRFHAAIVRPRDFDPRKGYPVLVDVYGGPHAQMVQVNAYRYLLTQWFADKGFIVVSLDGRGTPGRGRDWERALRGSYIKVPLQDQVAGLRALGQKYKEMDLERAGIFGWSYGGYVSALAVMREPEVFRAGVAGAPVSDWLDYDTHYTERYIGLPDAHPESYEESSVLNSATLLERPLLIIHGTDDDNVYFTHSIKLCDALYRAGKPFEFLPLVGFTHMVTDPRVTEMLQERIANFFIRELGKPAAGASRKKTE